MFKPTDDPALTEEEQVARDVAKVKKRNARRDTQRLIQAVLASPVDPVSEAGEIVLPDGEISLGEMASLNTSVQARIILNTAVDAASGDAKARDFLFRYGGLEPVKEQQVTMEMPVFVNDIPKPDGVDDDDDEGEEGVVEDVYDDGTVD